ncbi:MAG: hypothetical protein J5714_04470 [Alphaproteobacteria bacterium]|nr:hypothetical protein [Alphaproteobacteria bacterium]
MKKTLLSVVAGLAVIGSAVAVPSLDRQRENCESDSGFVWVERTKTCVPVNPCVSDDPEIKRVYCDDITFADTSLSYGSAIQVLEIPSLYEMCLGSYSGGVATINVKYPWASKPNYLAKQDVAEGTYKVYKFADAWLDRSSAFEFLNAICNGISGAGGTWGTTYYNKDGFASITCSSDCQGVYKLLKDTTDFMFDFDINYENNSITISFKSEQACYSYDDCIKK